MDFNSSFMELPKSSSTLSSEMQRPIRTHGSMPSDKKIQQDEDERDPRFVQLLKEELFCFWKQQKEEILRSDLKRKHELPISRIRREMKSNDQVKMVSAHSTVLFSKAIEMFILELTFRAWMQADQFKRRTLKRYDFARAIRDEELFDFLSDIVPLHTYKVEEANAVQGNKFHLANQMVQPHNIPQLYPFQVGGEATGGQGNEFDPAYQTVQPNDIPVQAEPNDGQGNEFQPTYQMGQPNNIPVQAEQNDGQGNGCHPTYQMGQPNNIPVEEDVNGGQGNEFDPVYPMVQRNNIPASFFSIHGIPAPLTLPPLITEAEFMIDGFFMDSMEGL